MRLLSLLLVAGCPWIDAKELDQRLDADGDGFEAASVGGTDCDDTNPDVHPRAPEVCNGVDDDCDGRIDPEGGVTDGSTFFEDEDGDGFGAIDAPVSACQIREGISLSDEDCDDGSRTVSPNGIERCNGIDDDCDGSTDEDAEDSITFYQDVDGDGAGDPAAPLLACTQPVGASDNGDDCAPNDPDVHPNTNWFNDLDEDGFGAGNVAAARCIGPTGTVPNDDDCDDHDDTLNPDTPWYADTDGDLFGDPLVVTYQCLAPGTDWRRNRNDCDDSDPSLNPNTPWFIDADGDGLQGTMVTACLQPPNSSDSSPDCDDSDPLILEFKYWWVDADEDDWGTGTAIEACAEPVGDYASQPGDCDDSDDTIHPESEWATDADNDGYYAEGSPIVVQCEAPVHSALFVGDPDCDDADPNIFPGAFEICDNIDSDCDGSLEDSDAAQQRTWYRDDDGDGFGKEVFDVEACAQPEGYAAEFGDCETDDPYAYPGAPDACYDDYDADCADDDDFDCDGDGYTSLEYGGDDCNDNNPLVSPENPGIRSVPTDHATIQDAIDLSCPNDTILIEAGTYTQTAIAPIPLHFIGAGVGLSVLDGGGDGPILTLDGGGSVTHLTLQNGVAEEGGCLFAEGVDSLALNDLELLDCIATRSGGAVYAVALQSLTMSGIDVERSYGATGGALYMSSVVDGAISRFTCLDCEGSSGSVIMMVASTVNIDDVYLDHPTALASIIMAINVSGTFTNWVVDQPESILAGLSFVTAGGQGTPLVIDGLEVWQPAASAGGTSLLWSDGSTDLVARNLTQIGGEDAGPYIIPSAIRVGLLTGKATLSNVRLIGAQGPTLLTTSASAGRILLDHATIVRSEANGLVLDSANPLGIEVRNTVIVDSVGLGLQIQGDLPVMSGVDLFNNAGGDWPVGTSYLGFDGNISLVPDFLSYGPSLPDESVDVHLRPGSSLIDAGIGTDLDGSTADIGAYGGLTVNPLLVDDVDNDGLYDVWEVRFGLDPLVDSTSLDPDLDGLNNLAEYNIGTFPNASDTDGDGIDDGDEIIGGTDPLDANSP